jgi:hypothetical protein
MSSAARRGPRFLASSSVADAPAAPAAASFFFFLDGKATKWTKPGCGATASALAAANGAVVNLVQRASYNGHYMSMARRAVRLEPHGHLLNSSVRGACRR